MSVTLSPNPFMFDSNRPPLNPLPTEVFKSRFRVLANQMPIQGVVSIEIEMNSFMGADVFNATIATYADEERPIDWWCDQDEIEIEIQQTVIRPEHAQYNLQPTWATLFVGEVDGLRPDFLRGIVEVKGRDFTAKLVETALQEAYPNVRASELARRFAEQHGLQADVVDSPNLAGANYTRSRSTSSLSTFSRASNQWDLLVHHAMREGYDVWVQGRTLHYKPMEEPDPEKAWEIHFKPPETISRGMATNAVATTIFLNAHTLQVNRQLNLAKDIEVTVQSRDAGSGNNIIATVRGNRARTEAPRARGGRRRSAASEDDLGVLAGIPRESELNGEETGSSGSSGSASGFRAPTRASTQVKRYTFTVPGITNQEEALRVAQSKLEDISKYEREISFEVRSAFICTPRDMVKLIGTKSSFDQDYFVHENRISYGEQGMVQNIMCKNTSPRDEVQGAMEGEEGGSEAEARRRSTDEREEMDGEAGDILGEPIPSVSPSDIPTQGQLP